MTCTSGDEGQKEKGGGEGGEGRGGEMHALRSFSRTILQPARIPEYQCTGIDVRQTMVNTSVGTWENVQPAYLVHSMGVIEENLNCDVASQFALVELIE